MNGGPGQSPKITQSRTESFLQVEGRLRWSSPVPARRIYRCADASPLCRPRSRGTAAHWRAPTITTLHPGSDLPIDWATPIGPSCEVDTASFTSRNHLTSSFFSASIPHLSVSSIVLTTRVTSRVGTGLIQRQGNQREEYSSLTFRPTHEHHTFRHGISVSSATWAPESFS